VHLYLIRHGETDYNASGRIQGWLDVPLNEAGRRQARAIAARLAAKPIAHIYASPLARAADTARTVAIAIGIELSFDDRLREYNMGDWQGLTGDEITAQTPAFLDVEHNEIPGGETAAQMHVRVANFLGDVIARHSNGNGRERIAVVSHGGTLGAMLGVMLGMTVRRRQPFTFGNVSLTEVMWEGARWKVRTMNDQAHVTFTCP
jgi:broad specificity phosphatase PhoE